MVGSYSAWLVLLSVVVAIFASYTALDLSTRITASKDRAARLWLSGGAFSMGVGIWSMHFIGMLAFSLPIPMGYDVPVTLLSMLIAIVVSYFALHTVTRSTVSNKNLLVGGGLMALGISAMHYTGMAAARFAHDSVCRTGASVDNSWMAGTIAGFTFIILCVTLGLLLYDARVATGTARMAASLQQANEELQRMALQDGLTRLPNRILLEDRLGQAIVHAQRSRSVCAVLFVDLDRFKAVNDTLGHFVGDELLKGVAGRLLFTVRVADTVSLRADPPAGPRMNLRLVTLA